MPPRPVLLVTGGSGFVGRALLGELLEPDPVIDAAEIRIFDSHPIERHTDSRIRYIRGDIRDSDALAAAAHGTHAVIHLAALVDWGTHSREEVLSINVTGAVNALEAARKAGAGVFVFTSSLDAVITGRPLRHVDEDLPYPERSPNAYCESKALAEKAVLGADGDGIRTVALRPASVWGEADPYHISSLIAVAASGPYTRIGDGSARQQHIYAGNVAHAHLLACRDLLEGRTETAGKAYFLTDSPGENFFDLFDPIVVGSGYPLRPGGRGMRISPGALLPVALISEAAAFLTRPFFRWAPKISRFALRYLVNDFTFTSERARRDFGFVPKYSYDEGMEKTVAWFREHGPVKPDGSPLVLGGKRRAVQEKQTAR